MGTFLIILPVIGTIHPLSAALFVGMRSGTPQAPHWARVTCAHRIKTDCKGTPEGWGPAGRGSVSMTEMLTVGSAPAGNTAEWIQEFTRITNTL